MFFFNDSADNNFIKKPVLFITYDGLLDPLGSSQILPYLYSIASHPRSVHVVSFEKYERFIKDADKLREDLSNKGIKWTPLSFTSHLGRIGKAWDLLKMHVVALGLQLRYKFSFAHCRSYQAMQVGCFLRRFFNTKIIFDMRGLWVDDRIDRGIWPQKKWMYRILYRYYKRVERRLLDCSDSIVVLTDSVIPEILKLSSNIKAPFFVIPCCADFDHFEPLSKSEKNSLRADVGINSDDLVISYLGSLGSLYLLEEMLVLFRECAKSRANMHFFLITKDWSDVHESMLDELDMINLKDCIHVRPATREEVPKLLGLSDIMLNFIKPTFSMKACSPTKMAEALSMGIPVISSSGVGDVDTLTRELDAGGVVNVNDPTEFKRVSADLESILAKGGDRLRLSARERLGLESAKCSYRVVYEKLEAQS